MKKLSLFIFLFLGLILFGSNLNSDTNLSSSETNEIIVLGDEFNEGWKDGYCEGWKDVKGQYAYCPYAPYPPYPPYGKDSYRGGYNMGFKAGMRAAQRN